MLSTAQDLAVADLVQINISLRSSSKAAKNNPLPDSYGLNPSVDILRGLEFDLDYASNTTEEPPTASHLSPVP